MDVVTRRSRYRRVPFPNKDGTPRRLNDNLFDALEDVLKLHAPGSKVRRPWGYPLLRMKDGAKLLGVHYRMYTKYCDLLDSEFNGYLDSSPDEDSTPWRSIPHRISKKGVEYLRKLGYEIKDPPHIGQRKHTLLECSIAASIELGAKQEGVEIIPWTDIQKSATYPQGIDNPLLIPVGDTILQPDWEPFVLHRPNGKSKYTFFPGFEADTGSEAVESDAENSIRWKLKHYLEIISSRTYETHYGAATFMVLFVTNTFRENPEQRIARMMRELSRLIAEKNYPKFYAKFFAFYVFPQKAEPPPATGHIVIDGGKRAGYPDYVLATGE